MQDFNDIDDDVKKLEVRVAKKLGALTGEKFTVEIVDFTKNISVVVNSSKLDIQHLGIKDLVNPLMSGEAEFEDDKVGLEPGLISVVVESESHLQIVYLYEGYMWCDYVVDEKSYEKFKKCSNGTRISLNSIPNC